jgi:2-hydroxyacyl-CoA lyase 1
MGKGLLPDTHELSIGAARSSALSHADVVLVLGARLNWILHYGSQPKWAEGVKFVRVDVESEGLDDMVRSEVALCGDLNEVAEQLIGMLEMRGERSGRRWDEWVRTLRNKVEANQDKAAKLAIVAPTPTTSSWTSELSPPDGPPPQRLTYHQAFGLVKAQLPPSHIFIGEGANTLDVGRTVFDVHEPRSRLDPGTQATMGVGMGSAIAAALVAEEQQRDGWKTREGKTLEGRRKVVAVLGDSAFGFSAMEVETAVRNRLGMLIVVMNNGGVSALIRVGRKCRTAPDPVLNEHQVYKGLSPTQYANVPLTSLPPTALLPEVRYELLATACGPHGRGYLVRTPDELVHAVKKGLDDQDDGVVTIVNLLMEPGGEKK